MKDFKGLTDGLKEVAADLLRHYSDSGESEDVVEILAKISEQQNDIIRLLRELVKLNTKPAPIVVIPNVPSYPAPTIKPNTYPTWPSYPGITWNSADMARADAYDSGYMPRVPDDDE